MCAMARIKSGPPSSDPFSRQVAKLVGTPAGAWFFIHVANRVDRVLIPASRGRLRMTGFLPGLLLIHRGARSGAERKTPLLYFSDGDDVVVIASNGGSARHPDWYHNVMRHPEVEL